MFELCFAELNELVSLSCVREEDDGADSILGSNLMEPMSNSVILDSRRETAYPLIRDWGISSMDSPRNRIGPMIRFPVRRRPPIDAPPPLRRRRHPSSQRRNPSRRRISRSSSSVAENPSPSPSQIPSGSSPNTRLLSFAPTRNARQRCSLQAAAYPRPQEIQWRKELTNSVRLIGIVSTLVEARDLPSGKVVAWTRLAVRKSLTDTTWLCRISRCSITRASSLSLLAIRAWVIVTGVLCFTNFDSIARYFVYRTGAYARCKKTEICRNYCKLKNVCQVCLWTGILLTVTIIYQYFETFEKEKAIEQCGLA
ncbi:uncharacterized protein LOC104414612 [Eucalyptus grandis]|uniref:uncharacterized protein LOC104414612 n=1 Tax=Eucalyptus grandis TaxID=71139 RepID=UPI00192E7A90|nr:uncharacterized protein LOC104414612 [Eucalyptus grandis]